MRMHVNDAHARCPVCSSLLSAGDHTSGERAGMTIIGCPFVPAGQVVGSTRSRRRPGYEGFDKAQKPKPWPHVSLSDEPTSRELRESAEQARIWFKW